MTEQFAFNFEAPRAVVEIRRSQARRTLSLEVHPDLRVILRAPSRCPETEIQRFLREREAWLERQIAFFRDRARQARGAAEVRHRLLGRELSLVRDPSCAPGVRLLEGDRLVLGGHLALEEAAAARALTAFYRAQAQTVFEPLVVRWHAHPRFNRFPLPRLGLRAMRTRWGSLSPRTGMCLNVLLVHFPEAAIEYVVVHELCHLYYHGHGKRFYALLEAVLPDWRERKRLLDGRG